ncbi:hypothetical protein Tco_0992124 [Tanacetum coccineum]|uniref:Xylulose kinase-1 n=1 Tax=Tanacetum coccineum TaxID=301880 RepID=A0ABQ5F1F0_9ASTR
MIAYLQKSEGSEGFHQIIDFLTTSHIKYALTENPTIYASLIKQFWQTATTSTFKDEDMEMFEQLALMGNMKRASKGYIGVDTPLFQTMFVQGQTLQGEGSTITVESHHTPTSAPSTSQPPTLSPSMPTTHVAEEVAPMPHDSPLPRVHSLRSDEGNKRTYGAAYTKLIMKVKKLEHKVKSIKARRKVRLIISDDEDDLEDPSKHGRKITQIDEDEGITLGQMGALTQGVYELVTTAGEGVSTARAIPEEKKAPKPKARGISFQDPKEVARSEVISPPVSKISAKDKGKAIMTEPKKPLKKKDQIQSDEELALRLHAEEQAKSKRLQKERVA